MHVTKKRRTELGEQPIAQKTDDENDSGSGSEGSDSEMESGDEMSEDEKPTAGEQQQKNGGKDGESKAPKHKKPVSIPLDQLNSESKSNFFQMETEELLSQVKVNYEGKLAKAEKMLRKIKEVIDGIPERIQAPVAEAEKQLAKTSKIVIPYPDPRPPADAKYKLGYSKPTYLNVVGSFASKTMIKESKGVSIDVAIAMPSSLFQDKDYLNLRYFYKRAFYLASLAAGIQAESSLSIKLTFEYLHGDLLRPVLVISPVADGSELDFSESKCSIRLLPCVQKDTFSAKKLRPDRNCLRPHTEEAAEIEVKDLLPTPFYNASLLSDSSMFSYLKSLHAASVTSAAFKDAAILGRIWLRQRGFSSSIEKGGFGHFEWSALQALLLRGGGVKGKPLFVSGYSNYQMFRATLQFLASRDLAATPLVIGECDYKPEKSEQPVLFDAQHNLNLLFKMTSWSYKMLRHEAQMTMVVLSKSIFDQFDNIFVNRIDKPCEKYDAVMQARLPSPEALAEISKAETTSTDKRSSYVRKIHAILSRALTDRVKRIDIHLPERSAWTLQNKPSKNDGKEVLIGLLFNPGTFNRAVDHGPPAESKKEAAQFRKFWGEKSELRRFKDGSILESCVWDISDPSNLVVFQIIKYALRQHCGEWVLQSLTFVGEESLLKRLPTPHPTGAVKTAIFQTAMTGFDKLVSDLRGLEGIPLHIRHIQPASPSLRYTSLDVPLPKTDAGNLMEPAEVVLQFETSNRWPDDLPAIQKTKLAFLLKIAELMEGEGMDVQTRVGLENPGHPLQNAGYLDIIYNSGPAFRVRIFHEKEESIITRKLKNKLISTHEKAELQLSLNILRKNFVETPLLNQAIQTACTRHPLLSSTIRLVKMWFRAQLLDSIHVSDEFIELLVARIFIHPFPYTAPASLISGFLRTLDFIAHWDWRQDPLIVDFSEEMTSADVEAIQSALEEARNLDPGFNKTTVFAVSNFQKKDGAVWTRGLEKVVAGRMTMVARAAEGLIRKSGINIPFDGLFTPSLKDYDFVIYLSPEVRKKYSNETKEVQKSVFKNLQITPKKPNSKFLGFHAAKLFYLDLVRNYSPDTAIFFLDETRYNVIAGVWNPGMVAGRDGWKVLVGINTYPEKADGDKIKLAGNRKAVLAEIGRLAGGKGLVEKIEVKGE